MKSSCIKLSKMMMIKFLMLVVPQTLSKYTLYPAFDALGHNGPARTYWYLKWMDYWKGLLKDVDTHVKEFIK